MREKVNVHGLAVLGLVIILLYSGVRTLTAVGDKGRKATVWETAEGELDLEPFLQDLEEVFAEVADSVYGCDDFRDPLVASKPPVQTKKRPRGEGGPRSSKAFGLHGRETRPKLTCLILDEDPAAIVEVGERSLVVKKGDLVEGNRVMEIDDRGVHLMVDGAVVTLR